MTKVSYYHIYNALVADDNDIVGKLAYSQYKRQKIEYILAFKEKHGELPNDADLAAFQDDGDHVRVEAVVLVEFLPGLLVEADFGRSLEALIGIVRGVAGEPDAAEAA